MGESTWASLLGRVYLGKLDIGRVIYWASLLGRVDPESLNDKLIIHLLSVQMSDIDHFIINGLRSRVLAPLESQISCIPLHTSN